MMLKRILLTLLLATVWGHAYDDDDSEWKKMRAKNLDYVQQWHEQNIKEANDADHLEVLPNLLIDHKASTVTFYGEATGLDVNEAIEFFLINTNSGHYYEALAWSFAEPKHINEALKKLGLPRGRSSDIRNIHFWPKGERVIMTMNGHRAESLIMNAQTGLALPSKGLVYTGSQWIERPTPQGSALAAQVREPHSIAANYNEPDSILDVPWQAPQSAVYTHQAQNPDIMFKKGQRILIRMTPEYKDGRRRVQDLELTVHSTETAASLGDLRFDVVNQTRKGTQTLTNATLDRLTEYFSNKVESGQDPFVCLRLSDGVTLGLAKDFATLLDSIDNESGIRMEGPTEGQFFYRAYLPNEKNRHRDDRFMHPWELHFDEEGKATLIRIDEHWVQGEPKPDITTEKMPVTGADDILSIVQTQNPDVRGIFVFAPPTLTFGDLMGFLRPVLPTHPHVHIYLNPPSSD